MIPLSCLWSSEPQVIYPFLDLDSAFLGVTHTGRPQHHVWNTTTLLSLSLTGGSFSPGPSTTCHLGTDLSTDPLVFPPLRFSVMGQSPNHHPAKPLSSGVTTGPWWPLAERIGCPVACRLPTRELHKQNLSRFCVSLQFVFHTIRLSGTQWEHL